jgi:hypothetical protein
MGLFSIKEGLRIIGDVQASVLTGDYNPADGAGVAAELGSIFLHQSGVTYKKTGVADTDWQPYSEVEHGGLVWESISAATTLEKNRGYVVDASTVYTVTMPIAPAIGDRIGFATLGNSETNNTTVSFNGANFNGLSDDLVLDLNYAYVEFLFTGDSATGWVLSNSDESGNIANIRTFIGNDDNSDSGVPEYTESNIIAQGDDLETAIDTLDVEAADVKNFIGKGDAADDLPTYSALAGVELDSGYVPGYIVDEENLFVSIGKLDEQLQTTAALATAGVEWGPVIEAITADDPTGKTTGAFSDDSGSISGTDFWDETAWEVGDEVLSVNAAVLGHLFQWSGTEWTDQGVLENYNARSVKFDFLDTAAGQRDGAAYLMKETGPDVIKIADFDLSTAATIKMATGYNPVSGNPSAADSIQGAVQKIDGNVDAVETVLGTAQGDTDLGNTGLNILADNTNVITAVTDLDNATSDNADYVGRDVTVDDAMPDFTALAGSGMDTDYTPNYISDSDDLTLSIAKLDQALKDSTEAMGAETTTTGITGETVVNTYSVAGNIGAKFLVFAWDGAGNRYAAEVYTLNNDTTVDFTEYGILSVGTSSLDIAAEVNGSDIELKVTPASGTYTVKVQRNLISA